MSARSNRRRAAANRATNAIMDLLFVSGGGGNVEVDRIAMMAKDGRDLGGWCKDALITWVRDEILKAMKELDEEKKS